MITKMTARAVIFMARAAPSFHWAGLNLWPFLGANSTAPHWALCRAVLNPARNAYRKPRRHTTPRPESKSLLHGLMRRKPVQHFDAPPYKICGDRYSERDLDQLYRPFTF